MKIIFDRDALYETVNIAAPMASNKNTIASIEGILIKTESETSCRICAYDLEKGFTTTLDCKVLEEGGYIINAVKLTQIIKLMPENGEVTIDVDQKTGRTKIYSGKAIFEVQALIGTDFPDFPQLRGDKGFKIKHQDLKDILVKTSFAVAQNDARPALNGLFLKIEGNTITSVGCDGNRMAMFSQTCELENTGITTDFNMEMILPGKSVYEITKLLSGGDETLTINMGRKNLIFFIRNYIFFTRLVDVEYVDYNRFIPKDSKIFVTLDTESFDNAITRALFITEDKQQGQAKSPVVINIKGNMLDVSSYSVSGRVSDEIFADKQGDDIEIGFNCKFLKDAVSMCDCEKIKLSLTSPLMSMTIEPVDQPEGQKYLLLVLPVRLNK